MQLNQSNCLKVYLVTLILNVYFFSEMIIYLLHADHEIDALVPPGYIADTRTLSFHYVK